MRSPPPNFDAAAVVVQRLAVLLDAGISPVSAWIHVAAAQIAVTLPAAGEKRVPDVVVEGLKSAHDIPERLRVAAGTAPPAELSAWAAVAVVWAVATRVGVPLAPTLDRMAEVLRALAQSAREIDIALAGPVATSRIVLALPAVGLAMGGLLGFDIWGVFITVPGLICLVLGGGLIGGGVAWNRRLVAGARTRDATPGLTFDLLAVALGGGASVDGARRLVEGVLDESALALHDDVDSVLDFARAAGVPVAALLRAEAEERRRTARSNAARRAVELESRLLFPLGLCVLPAFVVLGVAPIALAIASSTALPM